MTTEITISEDEQEFGPKMQALTAAQRRFILAVLVTGGRNGSEAAKMAGFSEKSATSIASQLMREPKILDAIREESERRLKSYAAMAVETLGQICQDQMHRDRFKAAARILDFAGLAAKNEQTININHTVDGSRLDQLRELRKLATEQGIDPYEYARVMKLIPGPGVIDAEFTEVFPEHSKPADDLSDIFA